MQQHSLLLPESVLSETGLAANRATVAPWDKGWG